MTTDPDLARLRISNPELARVLERCRARVAPKAQVEASEEQAELAERSGRLLSAGVPAPVREVLATGLDKTRLPVLKLAGAVLPHPPPLIVLVGPSGCGKTVAACWWLSTVEGGVFVPSAHLAALSERITADRPELHRLQRAPAVVVDDLGRGAENEAARARLGDFLCERADFGLPTVCTCLASNSLDYGESIGRRLTVLGCGQ
jgi:hypothetical protein